MTIGGTHALIFVEDTREGQARFSRVCGTDMKKGEIIISFFLAGLVLLLFIMLEQSWQTPSLEQVATSAEKYLLHKSGVPVPLPEIQGYERVEVFNISRGLRAALFRSDAATLGFAPGRLVMYDNAAQPVFQLQTLEGARENWTAVYDFNGRRGLPASNVHPHPLYLRDLTGNGKPDVVIGQYSGGNKCCTSLTLLELAKDSLVPIGQISGIDGWPFTGVEFRRLKPGPAWKAIVHRPQVTACGSREDAGDSVAVYAFAAGQYQDQTAQFGDYLKDQLRDDLARWSRDRNPPLSLLQSLAVLYAETGQPDEGKKFFQKNLPRFFPELLAQGQDVKGCQDDVDTLVDNLATPSSQ